MEQWQIQLRNKLKSIVGQNRPYKRCPTPEHKQGNFRESTLFWTHGQ